jgi:hypothetical protein
VTTKKAELERRKRDLRMEKLKRRQKPRATVHVTPEGESTKEA